MGKKNTGPLSELTDAVVFGGISSVVIVALLVDTGSQLASGIIDCGQTLWVSRLLTHGELSSTVPKPSSSLACFFLVCFSILAVIKPLMVIGQKLQW
jgi:hypothetical protein